MGDPTKHGWTPAREAEAARLWKDEGMSSSNIAKRLGGVTRNAVIGKLSRMGLTRGAKPEGATVVARAKPSAPRRIRAEFTPPPQREVAKPIPTRTTASEGFVMVAEAPDPDRPLVALEHLAANQCRFPIGDPRHPKFGFCGAQRAEGATYCPHHTSRAFTGFGKTSPKELMRSVRKYA